MKRCNVICLAIDRLHAGYLGAYGNTWIQTPAIDALAAESLVFDRAMIDSPQLETLYRSLWLGLHALCPVEREVGRDSLAAQFSRAGWHTTLLTDEARLAAHPLAAAFAQHIVVGTAGNAAEREDRAIVKSIEESDAAKFFAAAGDWLGTVDAPFFLWLHTGTLGRTWDASLEFRQQYTDEDDPAPGLSAEVPNRILPEQFDPDDLLAMTHSYAGQVSMIDELIGALLAAIEELGLADNTLLALVSPRGIHLGEHRRIGVCDEALYSELTHVPMMLRFPHGVDAAGRSQALIQPADLAATILDFGGLSSGKESAKQSSIGIGKSLMPLVLGETKIALDRACIIGPNHQQGIITPAWSLRMSQSDQIKLHVADSKSNDETALQIQNTELFVKPDDWFEVNEVSNRCSGVVEKLQAAFQEFASACQSGAPAPLAELPDDLILGLD